MEKILNNKKYTDTAIECDDFSKISDYALTPVKWAYSYGIIIGDKNNLFMPEKYATRAEVAEIISRYCRLTEK